MTQLRSFGKFLSNAWTLLSIICVVGSGLVWTIKTVYGHTEDNRAVAAQVKQHDDVLQSLKEVPGDIKVIKTDVGWLKRELDKRQ